MTSSNTLKKIISVGAALLMALGGSAIPAQAAPVTITYINGLNNSGTAPAAAQTDSNGDLTADSGSGLHSNAFTFMGWSTNDFNAFTAGSAPLIYGTSSVANSATIHANANTNLYAVWTLAVTSLSMSNPTEIPIWFSPVSNLDASAPTASDFTVTVDGTPVTVSSFTNGKIVLANALTSTQQVVRASFTPAVGRRLTSGGYVVPGFTNISVTTNSIQFPPTLSNATAGSTTYQGTTISYTSNFNGDLRYVVKLSTSAAPASAQNLADGTYGTDVVISSGSVAGTTSSGSRSMMISGLSASTSYKIWLAGKNSQFNTYSNMVEVSFTTSAPPAAPTITGTTNVGSSVTASAFGQWYYCATQHSSGSLAMDCSPIMGQMGSLAGSTVTIPANSNGMQSVNLVGKYLTVVVNQLAATTQLIGAAGPAVVPTISGTAVVGNTLTLTAGRNAMSGSWVLCTSPHTSALTSVPMDCLPFGRVVNGMENGLTLVVQANVYQGSTSVSTVGKYIAYADIAMNATQMSATKAVTAAGTVTTTDSTDVTDPVTEDKRPLPVWANNIVKSIPTLTKSLNTAGGAVALTDGDYADLKSVTIGGKAVTFKIESTGNVSIPVPAGQAGKTADIVIVFAGGTMTVQDGIKYVAPTDVATVVERPIAIAAGAKKLTEAVADQIRQAAFANMTNTTVQCVAYASKNTVAAKAAAKLTAIQACGIAAAANPALKVSEVSVIVNKAKAKKQAVGIKVYK